MQVIASMRGGLVKVSAGWEPKLLYLLRTTYTYSYLYKIYYYTTIRTPSVSLSNTIFPPTEY